MSLQRIQPNLFKWPLQGATAEAAEMVDVADVGGGAAAVAAGVAAMGGTATATRAQRARATSTGLADAFAAVELFVPSGSATQS